MWSMKLPIESIPASGWEAIGRLSVKRAVPMSDGSTVTIEFRELRIDGIDRSSFDLVLDSVDLVKSLLPYATRADQLPLPQDSETRSEEEDENVNG